MKIPAELCCIRHKLPLVETNEGATGRSALRCQKGCSAPILGGIPRFVNSANYASAFGLQWKTFRKTQLDSYTGTTISRDRLTRTVGGSLDILRGKKVLEIGCGAGRFTELMLTVADEVFACDLSSAVEANYENCGGAPNYFVCQADALQLPVKVHSFDFVIALGMIQHTRNPEETIAALTRYLQPGGTLVLDHYSQGYPQNFLQRSLRRVLIRLPPRLSKAIAVGMARALLPLHRLSWQKRRGVGRLRVMLVRHSPLIDYKDMYPQLGDKLLGEWAVLDTHDALTDHYKHIRTAEQIESCLRACGLTELEVYYGGNGVEARAKLPVKAEAAVV